MFVHFAHAFGSKIMLSDDKKQQRDQEFSLRFFCDWSLAMSLVVLEFVEPQPLHSHPSQRLEKEAAPA